MVWSGQVIWLHSGDRAKLNVGAENKTGHSIFLFFFKTFIRGHRGDIQIRTSRPILVILGR